MNLTWAGIGAQYCGLHKLKDTMSFWTVRLLSNLDNFFFFFYTTKPFYLETTKSKTPNVIVGKENSLQVISSKLRANFPPMEEEGALLLR
jgi:hypothetical protein